MRPAGSKFTRNPQESTKTRRPRAGSDRRHKFTRNSQEIHKNHKNEASGEAGKDTDINSTKTLYESGFKTPKILKDMFCKLAKERPSRLRELRTCGFTLAGTALMAHILDCPSGYVCRLSSLENWLYFPSTAKNLINRIIAIFKIVWNIKKILQDVLETINSTDVTVSFISSPTVTKLPPCFTPVPKVSKKRSMTSKGSSSRAAKVQRVDESNNDEETAG
ncbi:hypothetical protein BDB00DRAFT_880200 [Zychaea mexicana]|uniref:uncharacterized protein n=1 Tax=Zychaea mexicana TaxID=64656 RepID=UPI0022FE6D40|nr:uncharacterized protein BDB00DRAFT_880200 [Zychaea mexicana]KAI9469337.1 hypothetical protein BDB00DRAFT_880200 [Zychaea mexicana]